eukprot:scaffold1429_cov110-Cylindrotheca_fusiformis.AAC.16
MPETKIHADSNFLLSISPQARTIILLSTIFLCCPGAAICERENLGSAPPPPPVHSFVLPGWERKR